MAAGSPGLTSEIGLCRRTGLEQEHKEHASVTCSSVVPTYQIVNTEFLSTHHVKSFFFKGDSARFISNVWGM